MDYSELVKALRWCSVDEYVPCTGCPMNEETHGTGCFNIMHQRAAAAIEALQAQLPKRSQWTNLRFSEDGTSSVECILCGATIRNGFTKEPNYCPNCGAKMMEVQE